MFEKLGNHGMIRRICWSAVNRLIRRICWSAANRLQCCQSYFITELICFVEATLEAHHHRDLFIPHCSYYVTQYHTQELYLYMELELFISRGGSYLLLYYTMESHYWINSCYFALLHLLLQEHRLLLLLNYWVSRHLVVITTIVACDRYRDTGCITDLRTFGSFSHQRIFHCHPFVEHI